MKNFLIKCVLVFLLACSNRVYCSPLSVFFLAGKESAIPAEILSGVKKEVEERSSAIVSKARFDGVYRPNELVIAFGVEGAREASMFDPRIPVLSIFIPQKAFDELGHARNTERFSAIYIDQPFRRQMNLVRLVFPEMRRVGVLLGPNSQKDLSTLRAAAADDEIELSYGLISVQSELFPSFEKLLKESDVILAVPDPAVFNSGTISGILLTAYRRHVPLLGFSSSYVKAGALVALYSTAEQIGWQAAEAVSKFSNEGMLPSPRYPDYFTVGVNRYVARSMEIEIRDEATFEEKLGRMEGAP